MENLKVFIVFLGFIATVFSCQLSAVCDSQCSALEANITAKKADIKPTYRLLYHVAPPVGWMNDPNGFIYYKGNYHIFYQYYPYASQWGPMHWGHSTSPDLVNWQSQITALIPGTELCFSGSALVLGSTLVLMYTGHVQDINGTTLEESQYLAFSDNGLNFIKYSGNPVLKSSQREIKDFRDPKVWKHGDYWYVVIGSKTDDGNRGRVLLYRSMDLLSWTYLSVLVESNSQNETIYMYECPDFFELGGKYVLMMSPQGMTQVNDRYKNLFQTGYILGSFSYDTFKFVPETPFQEIDYGHDFYATQSTERDGSRILIAWFGMWQESGAKTTLKEAEDGWAGALTIFRNLTLSGTRILMKPVDKMVDLRGAVSKETLAKNDEIATLNKTGELIVSANWNETVELQLTGRANGSGSITLKWDLTNVIVDRNGDDRRVAWNPLPASTWRIFLDTSSLELFCGDGDVVFSSRVYPLGGWLVKNLSTQNLTVEAYPLKQSVS